jgi:hypothetical protein
MKNDNFTKAFYLIGFTITCLFFIILLSRCQKKSTAPSSTAQTNTKVWCFYQTNYGGHAFLDCAKSEQEYQQKLNMYNGLQFVVEVKSNCNDCQ